MLTCISTPSAMPAFLPASQPVSRNRIVRTSKLSSPARRPRVALFVCSARLSRRDVNRILLSSAVLSLIPAHVGTAHAVPELRRSAPDLRERLAAKIPRRPHNGLAQRDIVYPDFCAGSWHVSSTLAAVTAPAGYRLFGRTGALEDAIEGVGETVQYEARFVRSPLGVVADRAFNVASIAEGAMGKGCVLDCGTDPRRADTLVASVRPDGAGGAVFVVSARAVSRLQQYAPPPRRVGLDDDAALQGLLDGGAGDVLYASETVRQKVEPGNGALRARPLVKDVETTTVVFPGDRHGFEALQRTATYLTRDDLRFQDARGRPVDVRWYRVRYVPK